MATGVFSTMAWVRRSISASSASACDDAVDEAALERRLCVDRLAGEQHFHRLLAADAPRERDARRAAEESEFHSGGRELRVRRCDREVALRHQLAARGESETVHARDHGLRYARDAQHELGAARKSVFGERVITGLRAHFLQVVTRAERLAGAGDHDHAHLRVAADVVNCHTQRHYKWGWV